MNSDYTEYKTTQRIENEIKNIDKAAYNRLFRNKDKSDRATVEQVLDSRISRILYKLMNKGEIIEFNGCVSTGKEANVYHAKGPENKELAIKIYKTSILIFKDRERYISGEFRFRHGYCKGNPRKMVAVWAEKEVRNLKRLHLAGLNCPIPLVLKSNLIVMEYIGKDGIAAPRLKDAEIAEEEWDNVYLETINIMRTMFKKCKLVHADFSEYNILYYERKVYVIDVAQAVEGDHMNALSFLKRDCHNINSFFDRKGVETITDQQLFDIITTFELKESIGDIIDKNKLMNREKIKEDHKYIVRQNGLFIDFQVPRSLMDEDLDKITGNVEIEDALIKLCGVVKNKGEQFEKNKVVVANKESEESYEEDEEGEEESEESDSDEIEKDFLIVDKDGNIMEEQQESDEKKKKFDPFEGMSKVERKRKVKEENRDKRVNKKMTKKQKEKIIKKTSQKNKK